MINTIKHLHLFHCEQCLFWSLLFICLLTFVFVLLRYIENRRFRSRQVAATSETVRHCPSFELIHAVVQTGVFDGDPFNTSCRFDQGSQECLVCIRSGEGKLLDICFKKSSSAPCVFSSTAALHREFRRLQNLLNWRAFPLLRLSQGLERQGFMLVQYEGEPASSRWFRATWRGCVEQKYNLKPGEKPLLWHVEITFMS